MNNVSELELGCEKAT